jgi:hypothetical protein
MYDTTEHEPKLRFNGLTLGILATVLWMLAAGLVVQHRHDVPSLAAFKGSIANVAVCATTEVRQLNICLDDRYQALLGDWRRETAVAVVLPPMLGWILVALHGLAGGAGLFRRRQRA